MVGHTDRLPPLPTPVRLPPPIPARWYLPLGGALILQLILWLIWWPLPVLSVTYRASHVAFGPFYFTVAANLLLLVTLRRGTWGQRIACGSAILLGWIVRSLV